MTLTAPEVRAVAVEGRQPVSPLELFFDLVFVFAITQVTGFVAADPTWTRLVEGLAVLAALWWAWSCYAWLENTAASDEGLLRVAMFAAMAAMLIVSLAVPEAFGDDGLIFGVAYFAVIALHNATYFIVARDDPMLRVVTRQLTLSMLPAAALIVLAGALDGTAQALVWVAALAIDYGGLAMSGTEGWRVEPGHFAERHGLIVIIALGESIVALGVGAGGLDLDAGIVAGALLGLTVAAALWWAYFDVVSIVAERRLHRAEGVERVKIARDSYTYLHLPMVAGIVVFALGVKKTLGHVGEELDPVPAVALCGGVAAYLLALSAFKRRNVGSWNRPRLVAVAVLAVLVAVATAVPALVSLALVAATTCLLIAYEVVRYAEARDRIRHSA
jgi:low temperature requirement protein LtrA